MTVSVIWSSANGGSNFNATQNLGSGGIGDSPTTAETIFVRHDALHQLTNCKLYIAPFSGTYLGATNPQTDYDEIISENVGTVQINLDSGNSFPSGSWKDLSTAADQGTNPSNALSLGAIASGLTPNIRFQIRFKFPASTTVDVATYYFDLVMSYTYTS